LRDYLEIAKIDPNFHSIFLGDPHGKKKNRLTDRLGVPVPVWDGTQCPWAPWASGQLGIGTEKPSSEVLEGADP
jgi:hypothetical protein